MTATLRSTLAFAILTAALMTAGLIAAEAQQKRIDTINQEIMHHAR
jgi:hypothetical protein